MASSSQPARKRRRPAYSCTECRRRKVRCDRTQPCKQCTAHNVTFACKYEEHRRAPPVRREEMRLQSAPEESPSIETSPRNPTTSKRIRGTISKTRVFGHGHWMNTVTMAEELSPLYPLQECYDTIFRSANHSPQDRIADKVAQCKQLARDIKKERPSRGSLPADLHRSFPDRQVMDQLVELYFTTFESCYRILHLPSFRSDYRSYINHEEAARDPFLVQLLLLMTLAGTLHTDANVRSAMMTKGLTWIHTSQIWLSAPLEKDRLTLEGIQIYCLLLLARQVTRVGADLVWISAGSLVRMAMQMGLHQDPDCLEEMSVRQKEIRRRLWYTILEMNVQAALDSGMSPMVVDTDYNTHPPSNASDNDLEDAMQEEPRERTDLNPTRISFQSLLVGSLSLRLQATRVINSLQEEPSYDEVLALGNKLTIACRDAAIAIEQATSMGDVQFVAGFASSYCSHLLRRFLLCLHFPYAIKAKTNPLYSYSQKVCLAAAQDLVSLLEDDLYRRLLLTGGGMFRDIITRGASLIFLELCPDLEGDTSIFARRRDRARQQPLLQDAHRVVQYARDRMCHGETNVKVYVCLSMMMAQAESSLNGLPAKEAMSKALHESLETCHDLLKAMAVRSSTNATDLGMGSWESGGIMMPLSADLDAGFDFLGGGNLDLSFLDNYFHPQWAD